MSSDPPVPPSGTPGSQKVALQVTAQSQWSGPLPSPKDLEYFERVIPGGAARILSMAEKEQTHRITSEGDALNAQIKEGSRGQWLGALIAVIAVGGAVWNAISGGHWAVSVALVSVPVLGIIQAISRSGNNSR